MDSNIVIGEDEAGQPVCIDLEELLATRLLVQGNSGSGKSHLLRRLLEESAGLVQQVVIDPEGDFVSLADEFGHVVIDGAAHSVIEIEALAARVRQHRASVVLALEGLDVEQQIRCAAQFVTALFDAPREHWFPALVVVDEAQMFAPSVAGEISEDTRRITLNAMTNLMCRGRKRGLAGIVATQRLAKLAKNVAAEASNFLMGRTFLDIDMLRAADLLGMERRQAERIRDLERGRFLGLGPAICRRPTAVKVGPVKSGPKMVASKLAPLPSAPAGEMEALLHAELSAVVESQAEARRAPPPPPPISAAEVTERITRFEADPTAHGDVDMTPQTGTDAADAVQDILRTMAMDPGSAFQPAAALYQTFLLHCRRRQASAATPDMAGFRRMFAIALARLEDMEPEMQRHVLDMGAGLDDDLLAPFLTIARHAAMGLGEPDDEELSRVYGTSSPGRIRRLLEHLEKKGLIVVRNDFGGGRSLIVPGIDMGSDIGA